MNGLELQGIQNVHFGMDVVNQIGETIPSYGRRVLLVTEYPGTDQNNVKLLQKILNNAGIDPLLFDDIRSGVKASLLENIAEIGRAEKIQVVIGLGGMRVLSLARVATILIGSSTSLADIFRGRLPQTITSSYIEVPGSCRNHFMLKDACVITDSVNERAHFIELPPGLTKAVFIDPQLSLGLSKKYQTAAILDTLVASIEGYLSIKRNFMSDMYCKEAIRRLHKALFQTQQQPDEAQSRIVASEGGLLSCMGLSISSQGIGGTLSYMINAAFQVPKSWTAMVLLPHILDSYEARNEQRLWDIAEALGESEMQTEKAASQVAVVIRRFLARLELPTRLRDFNLSLEELYTICDAAAQFPLNANCGLGLDSNSIRELIKKAF